MKKIKQLVIAAVLLAGFSGVLLAPTYAGAVSAISDDVCKNNPDSIVCKNKTEKVDTFIKSGVNALLFLIGVASIIVIIIGGFMYTTSSGEAAQITKAKNMILYAVVGLVIAFSAYAIVNWVLKAFG